jgi:hypothetical protein
MHFSLSFGLIERYANEGHDFEEILDTRQFCARLVILFAEILCSLGLSHQN